MAKAKQARTVRGWMDAALAALREADAIMAARQAEAAPPAKPRRLHRRVYRRD